MEGLSFTPNLITATPSFFNLPRSQLGRLQLILTSPARVVSKTPKFAHITPVLKSLHWLKIEQRIHYKVASIIVLTKFSIGTTFLQRRSHRGSWEELKLPYPSQTRSWDTCECDEKFAPTYPNPLPTSLMTTKCIHYIHCDDVRLETFMWPIIHYSNHKKYYINMITESECPSYDYYICLMLLFALIIYNICVENDFPPSLRACELI